MNGSNTCRILDDDELEKQSAPVPFRFRREDPASLRASQIFGTPHKVPGAFQAFKHDPYLKKFPFQTNKTASQTSPKFGPTKPKTPIGSPKLKVLTPLLSVQAGLHPETLPSLDLGAAAVATEPGSEQVPQPRTPEYYYPPYGPVTPPPAPLAEKATQTEEESSSVTQ
jgi:hypothetical protein